MIWSDVAIAKKKKKELWCKKELSFLYHYSHFYSKTFQVIMVWFCRDLYKRCFPKFWLIVQIYCVCVCVCVCYDSKFSHYLTASSFPKNMDQCSLSIWDPRKWWSWRDTRQLRRHLSTVLLSLETEVHCKLCMNLIRDMVRTKKKISFSPQPFSYSVFCCPYFTNFDSPQLSVVCIVTCFCAEPLKLRHYMVQWGFLERDEVLCPVKPERLWDGQEGMRGQNHWGMSPPH